VSRPHESNPAADSPLALAPGVVAERVGSGYVLVHLETNRIYELQGTGARILELLRVGRTRGEIERALLDEFDVAADRLAAELDHHLGELRRLRLLA
jgi:hypothetical protein